MKATRSNRGSKYSIESRTEAGALSTLFEASFATCLYLDDSISEMINGLFEAFLKEVEALF